MTVDDIREGDLVVTTIDWTFLANQYKNYTYPKSDQILTIREINEGLGMFYLKFKEIPDDKTPGGGYAGKNFRPYTLDGASIDELADKLIEIYEKRGQGDVCMGV